MTKKPPHIPGVVSESFYILLRSYLNLHQFMHQFALYMHRNIDARQVIG
ncbi:MAG: hypothetical protein ACRESZ_14325 [Methylococcales bacterium]